MKLESLGHFVALLCVLLLLAPALPAQQQVTTPKQAVGEEPRHDYKAVADDGTATYVFIMRNKAEIDNKLVAEKDMVAVGQPDLSAVGWKVVDRWRRDPVVSEPLKDLDDIKKHADELSLAVDQSLLISEEGKKEFKDKIAAGACVIGPMRSRFFQAMVNKTSVVWKGEVVPAVFDRTQVCEFFLESVSTVVALVMDCGNFTFYFNSIVYTTTRVTKRPEVAEPVPVQEEVAVPPAKPKQPLSCSVRVAPKVVRGADETVRVRFEVNNPDNLKFDEQITSSPLGLGPLGREISVRRGEVAYFTGTTTFTMIGRDEEGREFTCADAATFQSEPQAHKGHGKAVGITAVVGAAVVAVILLATKGKAQPAVSAGKPVPGGGVISPP